MDKNARKITNVLFLENLIIQIARGKKNKTKWAMKQLSKAGIFSEKQV